MSLISAIAIYFVVWWICLFVVLPWGIKTQDDEGEVVLGTTSSAPVRPQLAKKFLATTILAAIILAGMQLIVVSGITLDDVPLLPRFD